MGDRSCNRRRDNLGENGRYVVLRDSEDVVDCMNVGINREVLEEGMV